MRRRTRSTLEAIGIEQREEQLEVLFDTGVRRGGHEDEVARQGSGQPAKLVALGFLDLAAHVVRGHLVGLVDHDEVPVGGRQLGLKVLVARQVIKARDQQRPLTERVSAARGLDHVLGEDLERQRELLPQLVLPLLDQAPRRDDQAPFDVTPDHQLLAEQPGHDRLTRTRIIGQEKAQRLTGQHLFVDRFDLVRKRVEIRRLGREERIEKVSQRYPFRLGHEPEKVPFGVHRPRPPGRLDHEPGFVLAVEQLLAHPAAQFVRVGQGYSAGAVPGGVDHLHGAVTQNTQDQSSLGELLES